jgi:hypothetical protein
VAQHVVEQVSALQRIEGDSGRNSRQKQRHRLYANQGSLFPPQSTTKGAVHARSALSKIWEASVKISGNMGWRLEIYLDRDLGDIWVH